MKAGCDILSINYVEGGLSYARNESIGKRKTESERE